MKKIIFGLAILLAAGIAVNAQQPDRPMQQSDRQQFRHHGHDGEGRDMMAKKLNFSDQQKQQLKTINSDYHKKVMDLKKNEDITIRESKARMSALRKDHRAQMQALLTPAQKDQIAKMKQDRMQMAKVDANARAEKMKIKLGLSDAQASQLKTIRTDMMTKMKSIHTDNSLSDEQKHEQMKTLVMQQKDQLKTILTPDQLQQMQQMRGQHHRREFSK
jgi:Spy/CpxP family protein refolding chaperone